MGTRLRQESYLHIIPDETSGYINVRFLRNRRPPSGSVSINVGCRRHPFLLVNLIEKNNQLSGKNNCLNPEGFPIYKKPAICNP